jgi:hypothetical protein
VWAPDRLGKSGRGAGLLLLILRRVGTPVMSTPEESSAQRQNQVALRGICSVHQGPKGFISVVVTKLADGRLEFDPHASEACTFTIEEHELIKAILRWRP